MARKAREISKSGNYYITLKGNELFVTDEDKKMFVEILEKNFATGIVHGYYLTKSEIRLVVKEGEKGISMTMKPVTTSYARYFNRTHEREGKLFADRFKSEPLETDEEIEEACHLACADEFIEQFPDKYDTHIEQGGTNVSGGQKQRLCIARALLKKPKILILDDSTSAVDTKTDAIIRAGFKKFIPETTKIIIAQRVSSVQDADQIIIMNNGSVEAIGTHDELLASNPIYQEVYYSQNKGGEQDEK